MYDWNSIIQSAKAQGKSVYDWLIATGVGDIDAQAACNNAIGAGQLGQDQAYLPPASWTSPPPGTTPPPDTTPPPPPPPNGGTEPPPILPPEDIRDGIGEGGGMPPIGQVTPGEAWGYGGEPRTGWLNRLMAGGMYGYSPAQQWAYEQYDPTMKSYELANQLRMLQGVPETTWGQAPFRSAVDPGLWGQMLGVQGTQAGQDWIGQNPAGVWDIGVGSLAGGRVTPGTEWLKYQYPRQMNVWAAQHDPGVQGTEGMSWLDYIKGYMGI